LVFKAMAKAMPPVTTSAGTINLALSTGADGGTVVIEGTVTYSAGSGAGAIARTETYDLTASWTSLNVPFEGTTYASWGNAIIKGPLTATNSDSGVAYAGTLAQTGSLSVGTNQYTFDASSTLADTTATYTGTLNGDSITGSYTAVAPVTASTSYSCNITTKGFCVEFGQYATQSQSTLDCTSLGGTLLPSLCPVTNRVGSCIIGFETTRTYTPTYNVTTAQTWCQANSGTFTPN
jgi:hypothetical protein